MLISSKYRFIFVHIYKNAGTSITSALSPFVAGPWRLRAHNILNRLNISLLDPRPLHAHANASEIAASIGRELFESYFSFAIVRNPWDWQVSLYTYILQNPRHYQHQLIKSFSGFDEYVRWRCAREVRYQKDFIYSEDGKLLVEFIGRFERLDSDFREICARIGISASLPKLNVSNTIPYRNFYTEETAELIRLAFEPDIRLFNYEFD